jgi:hypothetical protein
VSQVNNCCGDPSQCWEPCGILGKDATHVRRSPASFDGSPLKDGQFDFTLPDGYGDVQATITPPRQPADGLDEPRLPFRIALVIAIALLVVDLLARWVGGAR